MRSKPAHLQPWKAHAIRLASTRGLRTVAAMLTQFYGFSITHEAVRWACRGRNPTPFGINRVDSGMAESNRDRRQDRAESWLSGNDPDYAVSRRQWQQPYTDALTRARDIENEIADCALQIGRDVEIGPSVGGTSRPSEYDEEG
jgi:hypothetical protein